MPNTTKITGKKTAEAPLRNRVTKTFDAEAYGKLLAEVLPVRVETVEENRRVIKIVDDLMRKGRVLSPEEDKLLTLLIHLGSNFEQEYYKPKRLIKPHEMLRYLMKENGLRQRDIVPLIGSRGVTSEVVRGKRPISVAAAKRLAERFCLKLEAFLS